MSTINPTLDMVHTSAADAPESLSESFFAGLARTRTAQAEAHTRRVLIGKSDLSLAGLGFDAAEIAAIRATGKIPASFWSRSR